MKINGFISKLYSIFVIAMCAVLCLTGLSVCKAPFLADAQEAREGETVINVNAFEQRGAINPYLIGSNHRYAYNGYGMFDSENGTVYEDFEQKTAAVNYGSIRYPGGTMANTFKWKDTIGALEERTPVVLGSSYESDFPYYGLDEHFAYAESIGAETIYMIGEAWETPQDAADLVEYLNAPNDGSNPGGGIDWAAVRAANGHEEPYNVTEFEIGNEMTLPNQRYWLGYDPAEGGEYTREQWTARYAFGDTVTVDTYRKGAQVNDDQLPPARKIGTWEDNIVEGIANEEFYTQYAPVVANTQTVYVDGVQYSEVDSFDLCGAQDKVYIFDDTTGKITFGNGVNGGIPATGAAVTVTYDHKHAGFVDYYTQMKEIAEEIGIDIRIYACFENIYDWLDGDQCDGVAYHAYIDMPSGITTAQELHDNYMFIADQTISTIATKRTNIITKSGRNDAVLAVTEYGTIPIPKVFTDSDSNLDLDEGRMLSRGLAIAGTVIGAAQQDIQILIHQGYTAYSFGGGPELPNAGNVYNSLYAPDPDDPSKTIVSAMGLAYDMIGNGIGKNMLTTSVIGNPSVNASGVSLSGMTSYDALQVLATYTDGEGMYLLVVNRDAVNDITASVNLNGYTIEGSAHIRIMNGESITSANTPENPDCVAITESEARLGYGGSTFSYRFPAHSIVSICLTEGSVSDSSACILKEEFEKDGTEELGSDWTFTSANTNNYGIVADPADSENHVLVLKRLNNKNTVATYTIPDEYSSVTNGLLSVKFRLYAEDSQKRINIRVDGKDNTGASKIQGNIALQQGQLMCNLVPRMNFSSAEWHDIEMIFDGKTKTYRFYCDGKYVQSQGTFNNDTDGYAKQIIFSAETSGTLYGGGIFYIDDFSVSVIDTEFEEAVTNVQDLVYTVKEDEVLTLPDTVEVVTNKGYTETAVVTWEGGAEHVFDTAGTYVIKGTFEKSTAYVLAQIEVVEKDVRVDFITNGGSSVEAQTLEYGTAVREPEQPSRDGYTFAGWYTDEALTQRYDFSQAVTADLTLYAKWEKSIEDGTTDSDTDDNASDDIQSGKKGCTGSAVMSGTTLAVLLFVGVGFCIAKKRNNARR